ncbi:MAG: imidazolonepropionase-like amidohydrolase, partial [Candidatus Azotimanducaceae bacterium]
MVECKSLTKKQKTMKIPSLRMQTSERGSLNITRKKKTALRTLALPLLIALPCLQQANAATYIQCERMLDGETLEVHKNKTITVENNRIKAVLDGAIEGRATDKTISMGDATCMPGLIDGHVHITSQQSPTRFSDRFRLDPADMALAAVSYAKRTLMIGFTTVRDLGSANNLSITLRDAVNKGHIVGPRIFTAGKSLASTGGHADPTNGTSQKFRGDPGP